MATYEVAKAGFVDQHVERIKAFYRERRDVMLRSIQEHFPPDARYTRPAGGLFVWAELPRDVDTRELLLDAIQDKVAGLPLALSALGMMVLHTAVHVPVPSPSGHAVLTLPILLPLSDEEDDLRRASLIRRGDRPRSGKA